MESKSPTLQEVYPDLSTEELAMAKENLDRYLTLILAIFERLEAIPPKE